MHGKLLGQFGSWRVGGSGLNHAGRPAGCNFHPHARPGIIQEPAQWLKEGSWRAILTSLGPLEIPANPSSPRSCSSGPSRAHHTVLCKRHPSGGQTRASDICLAPSPEHRPRHTRSLYRRQSQGQVYVCSLHPLQPPMWRPTRIHSSSTSPTLSAGTTPWHRSGCPRWLDLFRPHKYSCALPEVFTHAHENLQQVLLLYTTHSCGEVLLDLFTVLC